MRRTPLAPVGNMLTWLGGGSSGDVRHADERATYSTAGLLVGLNAVIAGGVAALAVTSASSAPWYLVLPFALVTGVLVGAFGRVLASSTAERRRGSGDVGRALVAVLIGVVVGELAVLTIFAGPVERELDANVDAARAAVAESERAHQLTDTDAAIAKLDADVDAAIQRRDEARIIARCEYNPTPDCPDEAITGDPGTGDEANQAQQAYLDAERDLTAARHERDTQLPVLTERRQELDALLAEDRARAERLALADRGLDARWAAMNGHTTQHPASMALRIGVVGFFVLLTVLPLLLRRWRGETVHDRRVQSRRLTERAEVDADTAVAIKRAEVRAARELDALAGVAPTQPAPQLASAEKMTEPAPPAPEPLALPAAEESDMPSDNLPVPVGRELDCPAKPEPVPALPAPPSDSGPLSRLPGPLPTVARALTSLVPGRVARAATAPVKRARTLLEEVEEITFSLKRTRKVTVSSEETDSEPAPPDELSTAERHALRQSAVASRILDSVDTAEPVDAQRLPGAELRARRELPLPEPGYELVNDERRELPTGGRRQLPPGTGE